MTRPYDAIVVGARCAGAPTAMLLARRGHRVLLVDRACFPSDTLSTNVIQGRGVAALHRWGLLNRVIATGCPPIETYRMDFGPFTIAGTPRPYDGFSTAYAPRRTVLDTILVDAAAEAGAEVRQRFNVDEFLIEDGTVVGIRGHGEGGRSVIEKAGVVIGADGRNSHLAKAVSAPQYNQKPKLQWGYYSYWRDLPVDGFEIFSRPNRAWAAIPSNEGLTLVVAGRPSAESGAFKRDIERHFFDILDLAPAFAERVRAATRVEPFLGGGVPNFFRKPFGPGWVLVGDAGYTKDPVTAQGISDAFDDAERCVKALSGVWAGSTSFTAAMSAYQLTRDTHALPIYDFTTQLATLEAPPPELRQVLAATHGNRDAMDDFVSLTAGTVTAAQFFDPGNVGRIMAGATGAAVAV